MEQLSLAFDPDLFWDEPGFSDFWGDGTLDFDNLEFPELPGPTAEDHPREPPEYQQPQIPDQTTTETGLSDDSSIEPDIWELINADLELYTVFQTSTLGDSASHGSQWTSSPGRSTYTQSSAGSQSAWTSPAFMNTSPVLPDLHLQTPSLHVSPVPMSAYSLDITAASPALPTMPENPEPSPVARTVHNRHQRKVARRQQRRDPQAIPARERRKQTKPAKCPICDHGHAYPADLKKHIASNHPEQAHEFQVSTARTHCTMCSKTFARRDHFLRHCRTQHAG